MEQRTARIVQKAIQDKEIMEMLLEELGMNANGAAKKLEYKSPASIYNILKGDTNITEDMSLRIKKKMPWVNSLFIDQGKLPIVLTTADEMKLQQHIFGLSKGKVEREPDEYLEALIETRDLLKKMAVHFGIK